MTPRRVSKLLPGLTLSWIVLIQVATAIPKMTQQDTEDPLVTPGVVFYTYQTHDTAGTPLNKDLEGILPSHPLTLVMHGFKGDSTTKSMLAIKEAYLYTNKQNLVVVDWGQHSDVPNTTALTAYHHVRDHGVPTTATLVARWLKQVMTLKNISPDQVHLVGFSLGAHLAGVVGRLLSSSIGRITALDPPKFGYVTVPAHQRLDASAAKFVNVIHTSSGVLGYPEPIGHVDFFPNGDALPQPGCPTESPIHIITCSHYLSFMLFSETVLHENSLLATECESWLAFIAGLCTKRDKAPMGFATPNTTRGTFFMKTNENPPFGVEDSSQPLPEDIRELLTYDEADILLDTLDAVKFFANKESQEESVDVDNTLSADVGSSVMRVKSGRSSFSGTSTTQAPPAFLNSSSFQKVLSLVVFFLSGLNLRHTLFPGPYLL